MAVSASAELALESRLAQAVRGQEFVLHFQPQQRLSDGALVGFEALIRWAHPAQGLVGPEAFLPVAESSRLMLPIGRWVLDHALGAAARAPPRPYPIVGLPILNGGRIENRWQPMSQLT